jgi:type I restriction enzyme R subunit
MRKCRYCWRRSRRFCARRVERGMNSPPCSASLFCDAMRQENELVPYPEREAANFKASMAQQQAVGKQFTLEQRKWLEMIRDHIAANLRIEIEDFEYAPFNKEGGIGKVYRLLGGGVCRR